jgi:hypothetical protein
MPANAQMLASAGINLKFALLWMVNVNPQNR